MKGATRLSAGAVVLRRIDGQWHCLVLRAYRNWDFPKGMVDAGEEPLRAALREVEEETGLTELTMPWGAGWRETEPYARGKVARYYVAESTKGRALLPVNPELGRPEHHEYRWVTLDAAQELVPPRLRPVLSWVRTLISA